MDHTTTFPLRNGSTRKITDAPTKLLGRLEAISASKMKNTASNKLKKKVLFFLTSTQSEAINTKTIVWIWKNYLAPSLHFYLHDGGSSEERFHIQIQRKTTMEVNQEFEMAKCCTLASLSHITKNWQKCY